MNAFDAFDDVMETLNSIKGLKSYMKSVGIKEYIHCLKA